MMNISRKFIQRCAIVYIALPTLVFLFLWLRPCIGIPVGIVAIFSVARILVASGARCQLDSLMPSCERVTVSIPVGLSFMALLLLWCILSGQGGFVPQDGDWHWRNALFRDLITHEWPVVYPKNNRALVFYTDPAPTGAVEGYSAWYRAVTINYCCIEPENHVFYRWLARRRGAECSP